MYSINTTTGEAIRDSDGKVVAPCQSRDDPDFQAYYNWVMQGNEPNVISSAPPGNPQISVSDYRDRFLEQEMIDVLQAAYDGDLTCRLLLLRLQTAGFVDLTDPVTVSGVDYLKSINILSNERATEILNF